MDLESTLGHPVPVPQRRIPKLCRQRTFTLVTAPGVVYQNVEAALFVPNPFEKIAGVFLGRVIAAHGNTDTPSTSNLICGVFNGSGQSIGCRLSANAASSDLDRCAVLSEYARDCFSRTTAGACNNRESILEEQHAPLFYARFSACLNAPDEPPIFCCSSIMAWISCSGRGGHPGTNTSTGMT